MAPHYCSLAPWDANLGPWAVQSAASRPSHRVLLLLRCCEKSACRRLLIPASPPALDTITPSLRPGRSSSPQHLLGWNPPSRPSLRPYSLIYPNWSEPKLFTSQGTENTKAYLEEEKEVFYFFFSNEGFSKKDETVISQWYSMFHKAALYCSPTFLGDSIWGGKTNIQVHRGCCFRFILTRSSSTCWVRNRLSVSGTTELRLECMGGIRLSFFPQRSGPLLVCHWRGLLLLNGSVAQLDFLSSQKLWASYKMEFTLTACLLLRDPWEFPGLIYAKCFFFFS